MGKKRRRPVGKEAETDDCLPISKRINNLQIDGQTGIPCSSPCVVEVNLSQQQEQQHASNNSSAMGMSTRTNKTDTSTAIPSAENPTRLPSDSDSTRSTLAYSPHLDLQHNPHYFSINEMLYNAHAERLKRSRSFMNRGFPNNS